VSGGRSFKEVKDQIEAILRRDGCAWQAPATGKRGGQPIYSPLAIKTGLALRLVFHQPLRQMAHVACKSRLIGDCAALEALGPAAGHRYAERKQKRLEELIAAGTIAAFPDAIRFVQAVAALGWRMAAASSSKNANEMMQSIRLDAGLSLLDVFSANVCGRDLPRGKPNPEIFLLAPRRSFGSHPHSASW
jgi:beta-phosphoglucomutase-like phosphatase (HAD superfamily)